MCIKYKERWFEVTCDHAKMRELVKEYSLSILDQQMSINGWQEYLLEGSDDNIMKFATEVMRDPYLGR